jgi:hypothetical protein
VYRQKLQTLTRSRCKGKQPKNIIATTENIRQCDDRFNTHKKLGYTEHQLMSMR